MLIAKSGREDREKRLIMLIDSDLIDITTGECIDISQYNTVELWLTNVIWRYKEERHPVFKFCGIF